MRDVKSPEESWYKIKNEEKVSSPALLIYPDRIDSNIRKMVEIAGSPHRLRPHVKTHKMPEIIRLQMNYGINKFKCSTIAEAEMVARCGASDILLAMQPAGPNMARFFSLKQMFPKTKLSCIADSEDIIIQLSNLARENSLETDVWLDINNGMNRTGVPPGIKARELLKMINDLPMINIAGLHVYDGHIHEKDLSIRQQKCNDAFVPVMTMFDEMKDTGFPSLNIVAGGSPTFGIHAQRKGVETSPGTILLWDYGYSSSFSDMSFLHAAVLFSRVVSKPAKDLICIDLGHKAVASEMPQPRIKIQGIDNYTILNHNEEHMVIRCNDAVDLRIGDPVYSIPWHICPTVDRFDSVSVIIDSSFTEEWKVEARKRKITI